MNELIHISVVIPVYKSEKTIDELYVRLNSTLLKLTNKFELIFVDDYSPDSSKKIIQDISNQDGKVRGIFLSRNFGQHNAITAGLDHARGDWIVVMDCDLQDAPEEIVNLYATAQQGYDVVVGKRAIRRDSFFKKLGSKLFYAAFKYLADSNVNDRIGNFGIYSKKVISEIKQLREHNRSFGLLAIWVGFKRKEIDINHGIRKHGKSSYTLRRMIKLAVDSIVAHSNKLLVISINLGFLIALSSFTLGMWYVLRYFISGTSFPGWTSLLVSIFFATGLIITTIGIVGLYIGKIFDEVKSRPLYIIDTTTFSKES
jgi:glycosyltransferase involved in cell wall biosynthesis